MGPPRQQPEVSVAGTAPLVRTKSEQEASTTAQQQELGMVAPYEVPDDLLHISPVMNPFRSSPQQALLVVPVQPTLQGLPASGPEVSDLENADPEEVDPEEVDPEDADPKDSNPEDADPEEADPGAPVELNQDWIVVFGTRAPEEYAGWNNLNGLVIDRRPQFAALEKGSSERRGVVDEIIQLVKNKGGEFRHRQDDGTIIVADPKRVVRRRLQGLLGDKLRYDTNKKSAVRSNERKHPSHVARVSQGNNTGGVGHEATGDHQAPSGAVLVPAAPTEDPFRKRLDSLFSDDFLSEPWMVEYEELSDHESRQGKPVHNDGSTVASSQTSPSTHGSRSSSPRRSDRSTSHDDVLTQPYAPGFRFVRYETFLMDCEVCGTRRVVFAKDLFGLRCATCNSDQDPIDGEGINDDLNDGNDDEKEGDSQSDRNERSNDEKDRDERSEDENRKGSDGSGSRSKQSYSSESSGNTDVRPESGCLDRTLLSLLTKASSIDGGPVTHPASEGGENNESLDCATAVSSMGRITAQTSSKSCLKNSYLVAEKANDKNKGSEQVYQLIDERIAQYLSSPIETMDPITQTSRSSLVADVLAKLKRKGGSIKLQDRDGAWNAANNKVAQCLVAHLFWVRSQQISTSNAPPTSVGIPIGTQSPPPVTQVSPVGLFVPDDIPSGSNIVGDISSSLHSATATGLQLASGATKRELSLLGDTAMVDSQETHSFQCGHHPTNQVMTIHAQLLLSVLHLS